jgi:hypothetical protein
MVNGAGFKGIQDSRIQGFRDSRIQGFKDSGIQGSGILNPES